MQWLRGVHHAVSATKVFLCTGVSRGATSIYSGTVTSDSQHVVTYSGTATSDSQHLVTLRKVI